MSDEMKELLRQKYADENLRRARAEREHRIHVSLLCQTFEQCRETAVDSMQIRMDEGY